VRVDRAIGVNALVVMVETLLEPIVLAFRTAAAPAGRQGRAAQNDAPASHFGHRLTNPRSRQTAAWVTEGAERIVPPAAGAARPRGPQTVA
jgi:hypothetical protein